MDAERLVSSWAHGRASVADDGTLRFDPVKPAGLAEKFRRAYVWISSHAILSPFAELEAGRAERVQRDELLLELYDEPAYASFVLLPLLNLMTSRRMVFVGAPGRGKTSM